MKWVWSVAASIISVAIITATVVIGGDAGATWIGIAGGGLSAFIYMLIDQMARR
jgi:hypothetical protein